MRSRKMASRGVLAGMLAVAAGLVLLTACGSEKAESSLAEYGATVRAGQITAADGYIEPGDSISLFDDFHPAIANLEPALRTALQQAVQDAAAGGVDIYVTGGWRSARYQEVLLAEAAWRYGSREEATKWVAKPEESRHVSGNAVDVGPTAAQSWLSQHGSEYGLCQTYANEIWHFELVVEPGYVCPSPAQDATETGVRSDDIDLPLASQAEPSNRYTMKMG